MASIASAYVSVLPVTTGFSSKLKSDLARVNLDKEGAAAGATFGGGMKKHTTSIFKDIAKLSLIHI